MNLFKFDAWIHCIMHINMWVNYMFINFINFCILGVFSVFLLRKILPGNIIIFHHNFYLFVVIICIFLVMSWVRLDREILPDLPHTHSSELFNSVMVLVSRKLGRKYRTNWVLNPEPVVYEFIALPARPQLLFTATSG